MRNTLLNPANIAGMVDTLLNRSITDIVGSDFLVTTPSANIVDEEDRFILELAAPGLEKGDFNIKVEKGSIIISVDKSQTIDSNEGKYKRKEYNYTAFKRSFLLPEETDTDNIVAKYQDGILTMTIGKKTMYTNTSKSIEIK